MGIVSDGSGDRALFKTVALYKTDADMPRVFMAFDNGYFQNIVFNVDFFGFSEIFRKDLALDKTDKSERLLIFEIFRGNFRQRE